MKALPSAAAAASCTLLVSIIGLLLSLLAAAGTGEPGGRAAMLVLWPMLEFQAVALYASVYLILRAKP